MRSRALNQETVFSTEQLSEREEVIPRLREIQDPERNLALLKQFLKGKRFRLDCGHFSTPCHNLGTTMVFIADTNPQVICFSCYD